MIRVTILDTETKKGVSVKYDRERLKKVDIAYTFFTTQATHMIQRYLQELKYGKKGGKKG